MKGLPGVQLQSYRRDFRIYRKEDVLFQLKSEVPPKNSKTSRGPNDVSIHFNISKSIS